MGTETYKDKEIDRKIRTKREDIHPSEGFDNKRMTSRNDRIEMIKQGQPSLDTLRWVYERGENAFVDRAGYDKACGAVALHYDKIPHDLFENVWRESKGWAAKYLAESPKATPEIIERIVEESRDRDVLLSVAQHKNTPDHIINNLADHPSAAIKEAVAMSPKATAETLDKIARDSKNLLSILKKLAYEEDRKDGLTYPEKVAISNKNISMNTLLSDEVLLSEMKTIRNSALGHAFKKMTEQNNNFASVFKRLNKREEQVSYEDQKEMLSFTGENSFIGRAMLAKHDSVFPSIQEEIIKTHSHPIEAIVAIENAKAYRDIPQTLTPKIQNKLGKTKAGKKAMEELISMLEMKQTFHGLEKTFVEKAGDPGTGQEDFLYLLVRRNPDITEKVLGNPSLDDEGFVFGIKQAGVEGNIKALLVASESDKVERYQATRILNILENVIGRDNYGTNDEERKENIVAARMTINNLRKIIEKPLSGENIERREELSSRLDAIQEKGKIEMIEIQSKAETESFDKIESLLEDLPSIDIPNELKFKA